MQKANSGHPGAAMALAPLVYTLWNRIMRFDPADPIWPNRDRFVLSNGHASMLQWSILHLTRTSAVNASYETVGAPAVTLDEIKRFRQLESKAPGHPEYHWVSGVETTTGPLGQGVATSVGMAMAEKFLANRYNKPGFELFDYRVYAVCGDGCMMEGVGSEAASLAGHLRPGQPVLDLRQQPHHHRGFHLDHLHRGCDCTLHRLSLECHACRGCQRHRADRRDTALICPRRHGRPTLIVIDSHIGYGAPKVQDTAEAHGDPLGADEVKVAKRNYGWPEDAQFLVPPEVYEEFARGVGARGAEAHRAWLEKLASYRLTYPALAAEIEQMQRRDLPEGWDRDLPVFAADPKGIAGRDASGAALNAIARNVPWFLGGSADVGPSNRTTLKFPGAGDFQAQSPGGRNLHFGIREHAMAAICNGLAVSKLRPFCATYFIFSDYARPALRLAALMELPVIYVFTHDAMGDGEDGPTHQPIEHLVSLRAMPGLTLFRPGDANEVIEAYRYILKLRHRPAVLALSRQALPTLDRSRYAAGERGGQWGVRARRCRRGAGADSDCDRQRAQPRGTGLRNAAQRRRSLPGRLHAFVGPVRAAICRLPRVGTAVHGHGTSGDRARLDSGLGALRRAEGTRDRHAHLRRVGALEGAAGKVRIRPGLDPEGSPGDAVVEQAVGAGR